MAWFGLGKPACPVGIREKAWIEMRMRWLGEQFGNERLTRGETIQPNDRNFIGDWDGTPEAGRMLFERICRLMDVSSSDVSLRYYDENSTDNDLNEPGVMYTPEQWLSDPTVFTANLARKLADYELNRRKLLSDEPDGYLVAELTPVVFGLGIFTANATLEGTNGHLNRHSYLPARVMAYALALHAWLRGDERPSWKNCLRRNAAETFDQGLRFLTATEDSLLTPFNIHSEEKTPPIHKLLDGLKRGSASARVWALWKLAGCDKSTSESVQAVAHCLTDRRAVIRAEAVRTLASYGKDAEPIVPELIDLLGDWDEEVRNAAAYALGTLALQPETVVPELAEQLADPTIVGSAAWALAQFGRRAESVLPRLIERLRDELARSNQSIDYLAYAVHSISPDPEDSFRKMIDSCDAELQPQISDLLPEHGSINPPLGSNGLYYWAGL